MNDRIKHRERFRPFAGSVPLEHAREFFELETYSPCMQFVASAEERDRADSSSCSFPHLSSADLPPSEEASLVNDFNALFRN